jgi:hypothetical protein
VGSDFGRSSEHMYPSFLNYLSVSILVNAGNIQIGTYRYVLGRNFKKIDHFFVSRYLHITLLTFYVTIIWKCPCGVLDNVSAFGTDERGFESTPGYQVL